MFGPGVIGLELGQALSRLGVKVEIFGVSGNLAGLADPVIRREAVASFSQELTLHLDSRTQVSLDENEHFWKTQTAALPWISVRDDRGISNVYLQATPGLPAYFLIGRDNSVAKGPSQIKNLDADIQALL